MYPRRRTAGLILTAVGDELIVFDERDHHLHTLPAPIPRVWEACDGATPAGQIAIATGLPATQVNAVLEQLLHANLLEGGFEQPPPTRDRRALVRKAALGAVILSVSAPMAVQASSGLCALWRRTDYRECEGITCPPCHTAYGIFTQRVIVMQAGNELYETTQECCEYPEGVVGTCHPWSRGEPPLETCPQ